MQPKTVLATTYAVNPFKGSEDGMGWNFVLQIARFNKVIAVTRENNQDNIEKYISKFPDDIYKNIQFIYFDLPYWMRFWKRGGRGAMLYFWLWQRAVVSFIRKQKLDFDIAHNLNFHNDWTPSHLWKLKKPFIWGPVGHHPLIPKQYLKPFHIRYLIKDRLTWLVKLAFWYLSPALKNTVKHADFVLCMNNSVPEVFRLEKEKYAILPSVATQDFGFQQKNEFNSFTVLSAGRMVPLKGFDLSIRAFAAFLDMIDVDERKKCKLIIVGSGPELNLYKSICNSCGIQDYVDFIDWIERSDLVKLYGQSSAFLFPSHEGAGMVVAEALSFGLPVVCLDNNGPGEFVNPSCGITVPHQDYENTIAQLEQALLKLFTDHTLQKSLGNNARQQFIDHYHWDRRGEYLNSIYQKINK